MKKNSKSKTSSMPKVDPYLESVVAKLVERLVSLERKLDIVVSQTSGSTGSSSSAGNQPKPPQNSQPKPPARPERTLYEAICADCHKVCEVPFRPTEARPVYCKECFAVRKSGGKKPFPVLTPVALAPKPASQFVAPQPPAPPVRAEAKNSKKNKPAKKGKKKK